MAAIVTGSGTVAVLTRALVTRALVTEAGVMGLQLILTSTVPADLEKVRPDGQCCT